MSRLDRLPDDLIDHIMLIASNMERRAATLIQSMFRGVFVRDRLRRFKGAVSITQIARNNPDPNFIRTVRASRYRQAMARLNR